MSLTIVLTSYLLVAIYTPLAVVSHFLCPYTSCLVADLCNHTYIPACGMEKREETQYRMFIDECDMHEVNCDRYRNFDLTTFSLCLRPPPMCPKRPRPGQHNTRPQSTETTPSTKTTDTTSVATSTSTDTNNNTNSSNSTDTSTGNNGTSNIQRFGSFKFDSDNQHTENSQFKESKNSVYVPDVIVPVSPSMIPSCLVKGRRRYTAEVRRKVLREAKRREREAKLAKKASENEKKKKKKKQRKNGRRSKKSRKNKDSGYLS